ncbi:hypothetical protein NP233_g4809 [Leucocoprinus birnbaumii]|uniref:Uncharacterized protein n=1 Tax=Leucocoprinus birnbaumii TaxID=56174 RepID=A0AAD5YSG7_9AGAR|nr:hypothetical protein NP233_g4809 [Leucocoprinus birnbaumii]
MPAVKAEQTEVHGIPADDAQPTYTPNGHHRQYAVDRSARVRENSLPYARPDPSYQQAQPAQYHPTVLAQAIAQATHETLLGTRNAVYLSALREITEVRSIAATYQRQAIQVYKELTDARDAYNHLWAKTKGFFCPQVERTEVGGQRQDSTSEASTSVSPLVQPTVSGPTPVSTTTTTPYHTCGPQAVPVAVNPTSVAPAIITPSHQLPGPIPEPNAASVTPAILEPATRQPATPSANGSTLVATSYDVHGPTSLPGGFRLIPHVGPWETSPRTRPSDLPFEVFWHKSDWFGRGYPNGTFVTDRNGGHLKHLMKGIRKTARKIWTELARRPNSWVATTFNKNGANFMENYIGTIEAIYPCLRMCAGHWKAQQIGISAYSHWYKNRSRYLDGTISV